jgi:hypothetical protein
MVKMNRMDRMPPFLSNKVKGSVHTDTPDGCNYDYDLSPYQGMPSAPQPGSDLPEPRVYGGRSGIGKKTSVE